MIYLKFYFNCYVCKTYAKMFRRSASENRSEKKRKKVWFEIHSDWNAPFCEKNIVIYNYEKSLIIPLALKLIFLYKIIYTKLFCKKKM